MLENLLSLILCIIFLGQVEAGTFLDLCPYYFVKDTTDLGLTIIIPSLIRGRLELILDGLT
jgi:hypothetical protein